MSATVTKTYTPEDLLRMPDGEAFELVDGNLVERKMGLASSYVGGRVFKLLDDYCEAHHCGWPFPDGAGYRCFPDAPDKVRRPDASFIRFGRLPNETLPEGHCPIAPDLVVEVVSPRDLVYEIDEKTEEFLSAGTTLVWVLNPSNRTVRIHHRQRPDVVLTLREQDELTGDEVLPGFRCRVGDLFTLPTGPA
jgi:Uma2 family endonuclease